MYTIMIYIFFSGHSVYVMLRVSHVLCAFVCLSAYLSLSPSVCLSACMCLWLCTYFDDVHAVRIKDWFLSRDRRFIALYTPGLNATAAPKSVVDVAMAQFVFLQLQGSFNVFTAQQLGRSPVSIQTQSLALARSQSWLPTQAIAFEWKPGLSVVRPSVTTVQDYTGLDWIRVGTCQPPYVSLWNADETRRHS